MSAGKIKPVLDALEGELDRATGLIASIQTLRRPPPAPIGHPGLPQLQLNLVRELAFLRCVLAWEVFLEDSFVVFLTGGAGLSGKTAKRRMTAQTGTLAREVLLGNQDYLTWNSAAAVNGRAKVWFKDQEPYLSAFSSFTTAKDIRVIRNRIAHNSGEAKDKFAVLRAAAVMPPSARKGMGPGGFLARTIGPQTQFDVYVADLRACARAIAQN